MKYIPLAFYALLVMVAASCSSPKSALQTNLNVPAQFQQVGTDTTSWANLKWKEFFTDPDLQNLIDTALVHNQDFNILLQRVEMSQVYYQMSRQQLFPSVGIQAGASKQKFGNYTIDGIDAHDSSPIEIDGKSLQLTNPGTSFNLGLTSSWEIDLWGKIRDAKNAAKARLAASEQGKRFAQTLLISQTAKAYYQLLALDEQLKIVQKNIKLQEAALEITKVQQAAGKATLLAVQKFEAQLYNTNAQKSQLLREQANTENAIRLLVGSLTVPIKRSIDINKQGNNLPLQVGVPSQLMLNRPDVAEASYLLQAAGFDVRSAQKAFYPSITINPFIGFNALKSNLLFASGSLAYGVTGGLFAPLFQQYALKGQHKIKLSEQKQAMLLYEKSIVQGISEVQTSVRNIDYCKSQIKDKTSEVNVLNNAVTTANDLYMYAYATYFEVISAQKDVLVAEVDLINIIKEQLFLYTDLYRALGGGN